MERLSDTPRSVLVVGAGIVGATIAVLRMMGKIQ